MARCSPGRRRRIMRRLRLSSLKSRRRVLALCCPASDDEEREVGQDVVPKIPYVRSAVVGRIVIERGRSGRRLGPIDGPDRSAKRCNSAPRNQPAASAPPQLLCTARCKSEFERAASCNTFEWPCGIWNKIRHQWKHHQPPLPPQRLSKSFTSLELPLQ